MNSANGEIVQDLRVAGTSFRLITDNPALASYAADALIFAGRGNSALDDHSCSIAARSVASVAEEVSRVPETARPFLFENGVTYHCLPNGTGYYVTAWGSVYGSIDFQRREASWLVADKTIAERSAFHLMMLDPLSLMLPANGVVIAHGAAVLCPDGMAALIFGKSGYGKSTLAFLLAHEYVNAGYRVMSDDCVILDFDGDDVRVFPVRTGYGLAPEMARRFGMDQSVRNIMMGARGKLYLKSVPGESSHSAIVGHAVFLGKSEEAGTESEPERLSASKGLEMFLGAQTSIPNPGLISRIGLYDRLAKSACCWAYAYRRWPSPVAVRDAIA